MSAEGYPAEYYDETENWYISRGNSRFGPCRFADLVDAIDLQLLKATDFVWHHRWSDWRQVKSVLCLEPFMGQTLCYEPASPVPVLRKSDFVQPIDIKPRETSKSNSVLRSFWRTKTANHFARISLVFFALFCLVTVSTLVFDNSTHGIVCIVVELSIFTALCMWTWKKKLLPLRFFASQLPTVAALAGMLLVVMNLSRLSAGFEVWQAKLLLAHRPISTEITRVVHDRTQNRFLELLRAADYAIRQSSNAALELKQNMEPKGITLTTMRTASARDQLVKNALALRAAAANALLAPTQYLLILDAERSSIDEAAQKLYPTDPLFVGPHLIAALAKRQQVLRERMEQTFVMIGAFYSAKADVAEFLVRNWDVAPTSRDPSTFADKATSDRYNWLVARVRATQTAVQDLERGNAKLIENRRALWTIKVGPPVWASI
jgi:hypothetical protein